MARLHLSAAALFCLAAIGAVVGCGESAPPGRTANAYNRSIASALLRKKVTSVEFRFEIDEMKDVVGTYVETDPVRIGEVIQALMASSRDKKIQIEPGMEDAIMDVISFNVEGQEAGVRFRMHHLDLDRRWGPEVKRIHARYRAISKTEE